jgi:hypothetical protein
MLAKRTPFSLMISMLQKPGRLSPAKWCEARCLVPADQAAYANRWIEGRTIAMLAAELNYWLGACRVRDAVSVTIL